MGDGNYRLLLPFQGLKAPEALVELSTASLWIWTATPRPASDRRKKLCRRARRQLHGRDIGGVFGLGAVQDQAAEVCAS
jgi:hypothetical protein